MALPDVVSKHPPTQGPMDFWQATNKIVLQAYTVAPETAFAANTLPLKEQPTFIPDPYIIPFRQSTIKCSVPRTSLIIDSSADVYCNTYPI